MKNVNLTAMNVPSFEEFKTRPVEEQVNLINYLGKQLDMTVKDIYEALGIGKNTYYAHLNFLKEQLPEGGYKRKYKRREPKELGAKEKQSPKTDSTDLVKLVYSNDAGESKEESAVINYVPEKSTIGFSLQLSESMSSEELCDNLEFLLKTIKRKQGTFFIQLKVEEQ